MITRVGFAAEIDAFVKARGPVTVGLSGAGQMGTDIIIGASLMAGVRLGVISDPRLDNSRAAAAMAGLDPEDVVVASTASDIDRAVEMGKLALPRL